MTTATHETASTNETDIRFDHPEAPLPDNLVADFRNNGFVRIRGLLTPDEVEEYGTAAAEYLAAHRQDSWTSSPTFTQLINVWLTSDEMRALTFHPRLVAVARQLAGVPLRLWHDQLLVKEPHNLAATTFHQDRPYWPHLGEKVGLGAWIALVDVPPKRGCMTFLPGSQTRVGLGAQQPDDDEDLFRADPSLTWVEQVTIPMRAGDCTFHTSRTGHRAQPNDTDDPRIAHAVIFMEDGTQYSGKDHPITDPLGLQPGDVLTGDTFPQV